jgi:hypothetical protein
MERKQNQISSDSEKDVVPSGFSSDIPPVHSDATRADPPFIDMEDPKDEEERIEGLLGGRQPDRPTRPRK